MGCYDSIIFKCPNCGKELEAQSKSGDCLFQVYPADAVPLNVAMDANRHAPFTCDCGANWVFSSVPHQYSNVKLFIERVQ